MHSPRRDTRLYIDGAWRSAEGGDEFAVTDPSDRAEVARVADASLADADLALTAAVDAAEMWRTTPAAVRADLLFAAHRVLTDRVEDLALLVTSEMGKPLSESRAEVHYAADFLRWFAEEATRITGSWRDAPDRGSRLLTMRGPVGPCLLVTPWNFPLAMGARKIGPALAAGCTVVVKPARQTPLSMLALAAILHEVGVPPGVVNVIPTTRSRAVVSRLLADPRLRKLSFTGSTEVGRELLVQSAGTVLRTSMELGGNAPFVVFDDADLDVAVREAMRAKLRNNGEACTAANRFYVHDDVVEEFTDRLAGRFRDLVVGPGRDEATDVGPLIDEAAVAKCDELVQDALARGARLVVGGARPAGTGSYYAPTVVARVAPDARITREEVFGPVAAITSFRDEGEVLSLANDSPYGLAAYVFTRDVHRALDFCEGLKTGMIGLNRGVLSSVAAPFGGVGASGFGREGGDEGIDEYLDLKYVAIDRPGGLDRPASRAGGSNEAAA